MKRNLQDNDPSKRVAEVITRLELGPDLVVRTAQDRTIIVEAADLAELCARLTMPTVKQLAHLSRLPGTTLPPMLGQVEVLEICNEKLCDLEKLLPQFTKLRSITFNCWGFESKNKDLCVHLLHLLADCESLRCVKLKHFQSRWPLQAALARFAPRLEELGIVRLTYLHPDSLSVEEFLDLHSFSSLKTLSLRGSLGPNSEKAVYWLPSLTKLDLSRNDIARVPSSLIRLQSLNLKNTKIRAEGLADIAKLTNLRKLNLCETDLHELPPVFCQLTNLTSLNLSETELTTLPSQFSDLILLECLCIVGNSLTADAITTVCQLTALDRLEIELHQLELPPQVGNLRALRHLDYYSDNNRHLPVELGFLSQLQCLDGPCHDGQSIAYSKQANLWIPLYMDDDLEFPMDMPEIEKFLAPMRAVLALRHHLIYLALAHDCDTPIIEALFWQHPLRPVS